MANNFNTLPVVSVGINSLMELVYQQTQEELAPQALDNLALLVQYKYADEDERELIGYLRLVDRLDSNQGSPGQDGCFWSSQPGKPRKGNSKAKKTMIRKRGRV